MYRNYEDYREYQKEYHRKWYHENKDRLRNKYNQSVEYRKEYYEKNKERILQRMKENYDADPQKYRDIANKYYKLKRDATRQTK